VSRMRGREVEISPHFRATATEMKMKGKSSSLSMVIRSVAGLGLSRTPDLFEISNKSLSKSLPILDFLYFCQ